MGWLICCNMYILFLIYFQKNLNWIQYMPNRGKTLLRIGISSNTIFRPRGNLNPNSFLETMFWWVDSGF
jgi:hypothetical protein